MAIFSVGALLGGSQGLVAATRVKPEIGPDTARLRVNRLLNMTGTRGRTAGNALGVLGLLFAGIESGLGYFNDGTLPDSAATIAAGKAASSSNAPCFINHNHTSKWSSLAIQQLMVMSMLQGLAQGLCSDLHVVQELQPSLVQ